jgi:hypothetical protein
MKKIKEFNFKDFRAKKIGMVRKRNNWLLTEAKEKAMFVGRRNVFYPLNRGDGEKKSEVNPIKWIIFIKLNDNFAHGAS